MARAEEKRRGFPRLGEITGNRFHRQSRLVSPFPKNKTLPGTPPRPAGSRTPPAVVPAEAFCPRSPFALPGVFFHQHGRGAGDNHQHHLTPATPAPYLPSKSPQEPSRIVTGALPGSPRKRQVGEGGD